MIEEREYSVVNWACEVLDMRDEIEELKRELKHTKRILEIREKSLAASDKSTREMTGIIVSAVLDPNSSINKDAAAIANAAAEGPVQ